MAVHWRAFPVRPRAAATQISAGGLIVPVGGSKAMQDAIIGTVVAVGEDVELPLVSGDVVIFSKCALRCSLGFRAGSGFYSASAHFDAV